MADTPPQKSPNDRIGRLIVVGLAFLSIVFVAGIWLSVEALIGEEREVSSAGAYLAASETTGTIADRGIAAAGQGISVADRLSGIGTASAAPASATTVNTIASAALRAHGHRAVATLLSVLVLAFAAALTVLALRQKRAAVTLETLVAERTSTLQDAIDSIDHGIALYDKEDRLVLVNRHFISNNPKISDVIALNARFEDIVRASFDRGQFDVSADGKEAAIAECIATHRRADGTTVTRLHSDGRVVQVSEHRMRNGGIATIGLDVTQQSQAEEKLRQSEEWFRFTAEAVPCGIIISTLSDGVILYANSAAHRTVGVESGNLQGRRAADFFVNPEDRKQLVESMRSEGEIQGYEFQLRNEANGEAIWIMMGGRVAVFGGEQVILTGFYEITARKEADAERRALQTQLREAQKMEAIGQLTGGIAHDFNNLLTMIMGNLEMLQDRVATDPRALHHVDVALTGATRSAELTQSLLAFARRQPLSPKISNVGACIAESVRLVDRSIGEDIEVKVDCVSEGWQVLVDEAQLSACIINLANNARDAMPRGGTLTISSSNVELGQDYAALHPGVKAGEYVAIEVSDTGTGMAPETVEKAFEPFFTTKEVGQGTGLGLSMVHGFVRQSGGHVKIDSAVGRGTTVRIYLPRATERRVARTSVPGEVAEPAGGNETVLVVEDNDGVRQTVAARLSGLGYRVVEAANGREAAAILDRPDQSIDLLFTDIIMPGEMDGYALARAAVERRPDLKVLLTSGYPGRRPLPKGERRSSLRMLSKPYRVTDLSRAVRTALQPA